MPTHKLNLKLLTIAIIAGSLLGCDSGDSSSAAPVVPPPIIVPDAGLTVPDTREDGSVLINTEISTLRVYYGTLAGDYRERFDVDPAAEEIDLSGVVLPGSYFYVVTAIDNEGRESLFSAEQQVTL